jgi:hypothetical protein
MSIEPYPYLQVRLLIGGYRLVAPARVDTGCDLPMVIPGALLPQLPPASYLHRVATASAQRVTGPMYEIVVDLQEQPGPFEADAVLLGDEYLVGLPVLNRYRITFDHGRRLVVEP